MGKNIKKFVSLEDARAQGASGLTSPHIDKISGFTVINIYSASEKTFTCSFDDNGYMIFGGRNTETPPNDEIWYTTISGDGVTVVAEDAFGDCKYIGPALVSHIAPKDNNGKGVIKFAEPITKLGFADAEFSEFYPIISPESESAIITGFSLPSSLYYLGYCSMQYCCGMSAITIPDSVTELWEFPDYEPISGNAACPFLMSRTYDEDTSVANGGVEKFITSKGEFTWQGNTMNDYVQVTLGNGKQYKIVDVIGV